MGPRFRGGDSRVNGSTAIRQFVCTQIIETALKLVKRT
jgi:hypothetical protein